MRERIIVLIDMDCFYAQIEQRLQPELYGTPIGVSQVTGTSSPGLLIAVSYEARKFGVKRGMAVAEARKICPTITICSVPSMENLRKADLTRYRAASEEVFGVIEAYSNIIVEKASIDEAYLDITTEVDAELNKIYENDLNKNNYIQSLIENADMYYPTTYLADGNDLAPDGQTELEEYDRIYHIKQWIDTVCRHDHEQLRLAVGAKFSEALRNHVLEKTKFHSSAGVGNNKMIAKLICSRHKPKKQTIIPPQFISKIYETTSISSIRNLGGKLGLALQTTFGIKTMGDLAAIPPQDIQTYFSNNATWLLKLLKGLDDELVKSRIEPKSIGVSKYFLPRNAISDLNGIKKWVDGLALDLSKRLYEDQSKHQRTARNIVCGFVSTSGINATKTFPLPDYRYETILTIMWSFLKPKLGNNNDPTKPPLSVLQMNMAASRFESGVDNRAKQITSWFKTDKKDLNNEKLNENKIENDGDVMKMEDQSNNNEENLTESNAEMKDLTVDEVKNTIENDDYLAQDIENNNDNDSEIIILDTENTIKHVNPFTKSMTTDKISYTKSKSISNVKSNTTKRKFSSSGGIKKKSSKTDKKVEQLGKISNFFKR